ENDNQTFVTVVLAVIDAASGTGRIALAGHEPPFILSGGTARAMTDLSRQPPLGAMEGFPYRSDALALERGEALFLFSDGVTEAEDGADGFFGRDRLAAALRPAGAEAPRAVVGAVLDAVASFVAGAPQADDITLLAVRRA
ncbi:MAG TPA: PP2C family protein-serine/threonine phosphatase, partial [Roseomonas sp.]